MKELITPSPLRAPYWMAIFGVSLPDLATDKVPNKSMFDKLTEKLLSQNVLPTQAVHDLISVLKVGTDPLNETLIETDSDKQALIIHNTYSRLDTTNLTTINSWYKSWTKQFIENADLAKDAYKNLDITARFTLFVPPSGRPTRGIEIQVQTPPPRDGFNIAIQLEGTAYGTCSYTERVWESQQMYLSSADMDAIAELVVDEDGFMDAASEDDTDIILDIIDRVFQCWLDDSELDFEGNTDSDCIDYDNHESDNMEMSQVEFRANNDEERRAYHSFKEAILELTANHVNG